MATKYQEPTGQETAGHLTQIVPPSAYEVFMEEQNLPIHHGIGVHDIRELPLAPWERMGGQGTFIELDGQAGLYGQYVVEVPAGGVLNAERHLYEEVFTVFEGRGSTEVWREGSSKKQTFEWQPGSHFAIPLNSWHRLVNATSSPALVLVATSAPPVMGLFQSRSFIFDNPVEFKDRYDESEDYFKPRDELEPEPESGRRCFAAACCRTSSTVICRWITAAALVTGGSHPGWRTLRFLPASYPNLPAGATPQPTITSRERCWSVYGAKAIPSIGR